MALLQEVFYRLLQQRAVFLNLLLVLYLWRLHPQVLARISNVVEQDQPDLQLGLVLLAGLPLLETLAFGLKWPLVSNLAQRARRPNWSILGVVFLPLLHLGMAALLFIAASQIAGLQPAGEAGFLPQLAYFAAFFLVLSKEGLLLAGWSKLFNERPQPDTTDPWRPRLPALLLDALGDLGLLVFSALAFSALWDFVILGAPVETGRGIGYLILQYFGVLIYLVLILPPLQMGSFPQSVYLACPRWQRVVGWTSQALVWLVIVVTVPRV
ncbi:MAG: hypothetical protein JW862_05575 [Anaerolineales bacterium]|nr:hypothetical protein [Anaerolineales bacterium]